MARAAPRKVVSGASVPFVAYFRVSTDKQGVSGLGLEAQREAVERHVRGAAGRIVAEFQEIESGKRNDRPQIAAAIRTCRTRRAVLVIARLDRLARNVAFVSNLMESGVEFVACDNPYATRLTIHILAAVAEYEREAISARTIAALAAAKARGVRLGNPHLRAGSSVATARARAVRAAKASEYATTVLDYIDQAEAAGAKSLRDRGRALTARGVLTPTGGVDWAPEQVRNILRYRNKPHAA